MCCKNISRGSWRKSRRIGARAIKIQSRRCWRRCWSWWATAHMASWSKPWKGRRPWSTQRARACWGRSCARCGLKIWRRLSTCTKSSESWQTLPGGDRSLPNGQALGPAVLLWLSGQVPRQARFPVNPDWHRQPVLRAVVWFGGRGGESRDAGRVMSKQKRMARVEQMEWAKIGAVQAGVRGHSRNCSV